MPTNNKEYYDKWHLQHREEHNKYQAEKVQCSCGISICRSNMAKHQKSKKHLKLIQNSGKSLSD